MTVAPRRRTARVVPVAADGRMLLLRGEDQADRAHWFTIGGGIEGDESESEAACRELREETGISITPDDLGDPFYVGPHDFVYNGATYNNHAFLFAVLLNPDIPVSFEGAEADEVIVAARWERPGYLEIGGGSSPALTSLLERAVDHVVF